MGCLAIITTETKCSHTGRGEIQREKSKDFLLPVSPLYITLVHDQGHHPALPTNPDHPQPLILDAVGADLSLLRLGESLRNIGEEFGLEGVESEEVSELPLEEECKSTLRELLCNCNSL